MITIHRYEANQQQYWNKFVAEAKNGHFLFNRQYMEYHADRFQDCSLLFFKKNKLIALLPANINKDKLISHGGLTFGGILSNSTMKTSLMLEVFDSLITYLREQNFNTLLYKTIPHIYHTISAEEDLYAIYCHQGELIHRDVNSVINLSEKIKFAKGKKEGIKKAIKAGINVINTNDFSSFFAIGEKILGDKYEAKPTHTAQEMEILATNFPDNIKLFASYQNDRMLAGIIVYESKNVAHTQYMFNSEEGLSCGALDIILNYLITDIYKDKKYFSFGISTENKGLYLNEGLIFQKELFSARTIVQDVYKITL